MQWLLAEVIIVCSRERKKIVTAPRNPRNLVEGERMEGHEVVEIGAKSCSIFEDVQELGFYLNYNGIR